MTIQYTKENFQKLIGYNYSIPSMPFYMIDTIIVESSYFTNGILEIPKGFKSDGCTLKGILKMFFGCQHTPEYLPASIIHDYILSNPSVVNNNRRKSSQVLKEVLLLEGVTYWKATLMYIGVELYQWWTNFKTHRWD